MSRGNGTPPKAIRQVKLHPSISPYCGDGGQDCKAGSRYICCLCSQQNNRIISLTHSPKFTRSFIAPVAIHSFVFSRFHPTLKSNLSHRKRESQRCSPSRYSLAAALLAAPMVHGHYIFSQLMVNGATVGGDYDYIRKNDNTYMPSFTADVINSENLRCNSGALNSPAKTADVKAGDEIGAKIWFNEVIEHPGPGMIYMSKAPGSVSDYKGDGDWFKVWESGPDNGPANVDTSWGTWQKDHMSFTLPKDIPDGEYLVRFEHVGIHENHVGKAQFYMECAQINVSGGGSGSPGPMVQIPGVYTAEDPAFTYSIWGGSDPGYTMPGPAVWTGGASSGGSSSASAGSSSAGSSASSGSASTEAPESSESSSEEAEAPAASGSASTGASTGASCKNARRASALVHGWLSHCASPTSG